MKRSMFEKYDNDCKYECACRCKQNDTDQNFRILESTPNLSLVVDALGNEIGVCAKHNTDCTLYFLMDGCVEKSSIEELVCNSIVSFDVIDYWHKTQLSKTFAGLSVYEDENTIKITISAADMATLKRETYKMRLTLSWPGGMYELYSEDNGFLTIG